MAARSAGFNTTGGSTPGTRATGQRPQRSVNGLPMATLRKIIKDTRPRTDADDRALEAAEAKRRRKNERRVEECRHC